MVRKRCGYIIIIILLTLTLGVSGCGPKSGVGGPSVTLPEPTPAEDKQKPLEMPQGPLESTAHGKAAAFKGTDFLTGEEVEFKPEESDRPAIISFFSPG